MVPDGAIEIQPDDLVWKSPNEEKVYLFDWDRRRLATAVTIDDFVFTITKVRGVGAATLTSDNETLLTGDRQTWLRVIGGTLGHTYQISCQITTNENPSQTFEQSFFVLIQ